MYTCIYVYAWYIWIELYVDRLCVCICIYIHTIHTCIYTHIAYLFLCRDRDACVHMNEPYCTYEWAMSHVWMSHVARMNEPCLSYTWVMWLMSHICMGHMPQTCHTLECVMTHICMNSVTRMKESCHTYEEITSHIYRSHATYIRKSCHTYIIPSHQQARRSPRALLLSLSRCLSRSILLLLPLSPSLSWIST